MKQDQPAPYWYHIHGVTRQGVNFELRPKAWVQADGKAWWQLDPFFQVLGLLHPQTKLCRWLDLRMDSIVASWKKAGITKEEAFMYSIRSQ
eukprot:5249831-Prorocentrum_lima.AAC.1